MREIVNKVFDDTRRNFIYTPDGEQYGVRDDWRSHAGEIGEPWRDDCDGFACTAAELMIDRGVPKEDVRLILCITETGIAHLVCGVDVDGDLNATLILDNRQRTVWSWTDIGYRWKKSMRISEPGTWRKYGNAKDE